MDLTRGESRLEHDLLSVVFQNDVSKLGMYVGSQHRPADVKMLTCLHGVLSYTPLS